VSSANWRQFCGLEVTSIIRMWKRAGCRLMSSLSSTSPLKPFSHNPLLFSHGRHSRPDIQHVQVRCMSNLPESTVYGGPKSRSPWKRVTLRNLNVKYEKKEPITVVTAYDYPSGAQITLFLFTSAQPSMCFEDLCQ
jgi:hypothetical protein